MEGRIQTQEHGFPENFAPKNMDLACLLPKIWVKLCFSHKFDVKRLFLRYYRIESSKNDSC